MNEKEVSLPKWDISNEALIRYVEIFEDDESIERDIAETYTMEHALKHNFTGTGKTGIGLKIGILNLEGGNTWSTSSDITTTEKISKTITTKYKLSSDHLGKQRIYFYDPLIVGISNASNGTISYNMHTYNSGHVMFGITAK